MCFSENCDNSPSADPKSKLKSARFGQDLAEFLDRSRVDWEDPNLVADFIATAVLSQEPSQFLSATDASRTIDLNAISPKKLLS